MVTGAAAAHQEAAGAEPQPLDQAQAAPAQQEAPLKRERADDDGRYKAKGAAEDALGRWCKHTPRGRALLFLRAGDRRNQMSCTMVSAASNEGLSERKEALLLLIVDKVLNGNS